jgi:predicted Zn-dependent protease
MTRAHKLRIALAGLALLVASASAPLAAAGQADAGKVSAASANGAAEAAADPLLRAMREELDRSKTQLKMESVPSPYYIEYRLSDVDAYEADAVFGAVRRSDRNRARSVRVVVRVGDYKQDSYYGPGVGAVTLAPIDDNPLALRRQLWMASDQAYKSASAALAAKKAALMKFTADQPFDDFARAPAVTSVGPVVKLDFDSRQWEDTLEKATAQYRGDPKLESVGAYVRFRAVNEYFVNSEGTQTRQGYTVYLLTLSGSTQAADGMRLDRSPYYAAATAKELPASDAVAADTANMIATLQKLREAPIVSEDYRGPVLFSPDASNDIFLGMIGRNVLGIRPKPGDAARTAGDFSSNYKGRVLPTFLSVDDDPTMQTFGGKTLVGAYPTDDEGVQAKKVSLIESGLLNNYLLGREPIRDFPESNGHGRAGPGQSTSPNIGNLVVSSKQPLSVAALQQKLIDLCKQQGMEYGYFVDTLGGNDYSPRLLYRVYTSDGHRELVRGAEFNELDTRALRNDVIAVGDDPLVGNRDGAVPTTVISPSILFDDLEVKRTDVKNSKLPEYPAPALTTAR